MKESIKRKHNGLKFKGLIIAFLFSFSFSVVTFPFASAVSMWSMTYGGTEDDIGSGETVQTSDGGYVISGPTNSSGAGGFDFWLFKTDANGNMEWNQTYGGGLDDVCDDMVQTNDGGYAIVGNTHSFGAGGQDFWLVKTDASGNMEWNMTYGGTSDDFAYSVVQTNDGGYAVAGNTYSFGSGMSDFWLVKTDASGNMEWNMTYGGTGNETDASVVQTSDGGYTFAGNTNSSGAGDFDASLVRTDVSGNMLWNMTYGGTGTDIGWFLVQTSDGGYAITGYTNSFTTLVRAWLVKTDASGNMEWNMTYGGIAEIGFHGIQTKDGGYAIVGTSYSSPLAQDFLLIKTYANGSMQWKQTYGGMGIDNGLSVVQTSDEGYALTGQTTSSGAGGLDVWLVKTDELGAIPEGLTFKVVLLLSSVVAAVSFSIFRKHPKWKKQ